MWFQISLPEDMWSQKRKVDIEKIDFPFVMEEYSIAKARITFKRNMSLILYYYYTVFHGFSANLQVVLTIDKQKLTWKTIFDLKFFLCPIKNFDRKIFCTKIFFWSKFWHAIKYFSAKNIYWTRKSSNLNQLWLSLAQLSPSLLLIYSLVSSSMLSCILFSNFLTMLLILSCCQTLYCHYSCLWCHVWCCPWCFCSMLSLMRFLDLSLIMFWS